MVGHQMRQVVSNTGILDLAQFYLDATAMGATQDKTLFEAELNALPALVKNEAETILVPGIYKNGKVYGFNGATKGLVEFDFSRASSATYVDKNGIMQVAAPGMPRIDHDPVTKNCRGYLLESSSINLVLRSADLTNGRWRKTGIELTQSLKATSYGKPFFKIARDNSAGTSSINQSIIIPIAPGNTFTYSITFRADTSNSLNFGIGAPNSSWGNPGDTIARIIRGPGTIVNSGGSISLTGLSVDIDTVVELTRTFTTTEPEAIIYIYPHSAQASASGLSVLAACPQFEKSLRSSSYIETGDAAVLRATDYMSSSADIVPYLSATVYADMSPLTNLVTVDSTMLLMKGISCRFVYTTGLSYRVYDGVSVIDLSDSSDIKPDGMRVKTATSYGNGQLKANINSRAVKKSSSPNVILGDSNLLSIGGDTHMMNIIQFPIKQLAVFSRQLTDQEHIDITI